MQRYSGFGFDLHTKCKIFLEHLNIVLHANSYTDCNKPLIKNALKKNFVKFDLKRESEKENFREICRSFIHNKCKSGHQKMIKSVPTVDKEALFTIPSICAIIQNVSNKTQQIDFQNIFEKFSFFYNLLIIF